MKTHLNTLLSVVCSIFKYIRIDYIVKHEEGAICVLTFT